MAIRRPKLPKVNIIDKAVVEIPKLKAKKAKAKVKKAVEVNQTMQAKDDILLLSKAIGYKMTNGQAEKFLEKISSNGIDSLRPITFYLTEACAPTGKDQQRIYDIIKKSQDKNGIVSICKADFAKMEKLAQNMNNAIKDEAKRKARKEACDFYGLTFLAECFSPKDQLNPKDELKLQGNGIGFGIDLGARNGLEEFKYKYEDLIDGIDDGIFYKPHNYVMKKAIDYKEDDDLIDEINETIKDM